MEAHSLSKEGPPTGHDYRSIRLRGFSSSHSARWNSARRSRTRQSRTQKRASGKRSDNRCRRHPMRADDEDERIFGAKEVEDSAANEQLDENQRPDQHPPRHRAFVYRRLDEFPRTFREKLASTYLPLPRCPVNCRFIETDYTASDRTYHCRKPLWLESDGMSTDRLGSRERRAASRLAAIPPHPLLGYN